MRTNVVNKERLRTNRSLRVRKHLHGTAERPRLSVYKTNKHIQVQLINDDAHATIGTCATYQKQFRSTEFGKKNKASARRLGTEIAQIAKGKNIKEVIFDRGPFKYHGILAEVADAAREAGLQF